MKTTKIITLLLLFILFLTCFPEISKGQEATNLEPYVSIANLVSGESAYQFTHRLTMDDMEGRQSGSKGCDLAAQWISSRFDEFGLSPYESSSYYQSVEVPYFNLCPPFLFRFQENNKWTHPVYRDDFMVFHYSGKGKVSNSCAFVGYGMDEPYDDYNDYEGISLLGKTALMLVDTPSFFKKEDGIYSIYYRINTAVSYGATSIVLLTETVEDAPFRFDMKMALGYDARVPVLIAKPKLSRSLVLSSQQNLDEIIAKIESSQKPYSFNFDMNLQIEVNFKEERRTSPNVIGYIPAVDPTNKESILITAHYDALGIDYLDNKIYRGANDNASSVGCLLEIARTMTQSECLPSLNIIFIAFTGEEEGLLGSYHYSKHPLFPLYKIQAVLNMEEVGTFEGTNIAGTSRSVYPDLSKKILTAAKLLGYKFSILPDLLYPGSDHYPFHEKEIPSVCFAKLSLQGGYPEYHKISDTIDIISPKSLEIFCRIVTLLTLTYSNSAYFSFSGFPESITGLHPFAVYSGSCFIPPGIDLDMFVNEDKLEWKPAGKFDLYIPLQSGLNEIQIAIKFKFTTRILKKYSLSCHPDPGLRIDFNQDNRIDVSDLALLSKSLEREALTYHINSLYDLNQDRVINRDDFNIFISSLKKKD